VNLIGIVDIRNKNPRTVMEKEESLTSEFEINCPHCDERIKAFGSFFNTCVQQNCIKCEEEFRVTPYYLFCAGCRSRIDCLGIPTKTLGRKKYWRRSLGHLCKILWGFAKEDVESAITVILLILAFVGACTVVYLTVKFIWFLIWLGLF
jgi:DNA-directed RNA polymerase subunit RPC12/RpoP